MSTINNGYPSAVQQSEEKKLMNSNLYHTAIDFTLNDSEEINPNEGINEPQSIEMLNDYEIIEEIGSGAQGTVYKVCKDRKFYAMKEVDGGSLKRNRRKRRKSNIANIRNEIAIMKLLDHPNIVRLYDVIDDEENDKLYLVMDFVDNSCIKDYDVAKGEATPLSEELAQKYFRGLVKGLTYLHYHNVIHRDIKPSNLLLDFNSEECKLCDFGVSSLTSESKSARVLGEDDVIFVGTCGTTAMLSPEALGAGIDHVYHGRGADLWAAGVTLYIFLFGVLPFHSSDSNEMRHKIITEKLTFPNKPKVSKSVKDLLTKMLEKNPEKRITLPAVCDHPWVDDDDKLKVTLTMQQMKTIIPNSEDLKHTISLGRIIKKVGKSIVKASSHITIGSSDDLPIINNYNDVENVSDFFNFICCGCFGLRNKTTNKEENQKLL